MLNIVTGGGVDFFSRRAIASFAPGSNRAVTLIRLLCDKEVEGNEEFTLTLSLPSSITSVTIGSQSTATAIITDSTSM